MLMRGFVFKVVFRVSVCLCVCGWVHSHVCVAPHDSLASRLLIFLPPTPVRRCCSRKAMTHSSVGNKSVCVYVCVCVVCVCVCMLHVQVYLGEQLPLSCEN